MTISAKVYVAGHLRCECHVDVDGLAVQQLVSVLQCGHLDLWREGVPVVHQAAQNVLPQVGLQLLQHPLNAAPHGHARRLVLHKTHMQTHTQNLLEELACCAAHAVLSTQHLRACCQPVGKDCPHYPAQQTMGAVQWLPCNRMHTCLCRACQQCAGCVSQKRFIAQHAV